MFFIPKNPLSVPEIDYIPSAQKGTRALFSTKQGWYETDSNGAVKKLITDADFDIEITNQRLNDFSGFMVATDGTITKILNGEITVGKAECDSDGNNINETFAELGNNLAKIINGETIVEKARYDSEGNNISHYYASNDDVGGIYDYVERNLNLINKDIAAINKAPATSQPNGDIFETNTAYHLGEQALMRVEFPSEASDGDMIYLNFYSGEIPTNFWMITTNTSDMELIPEANTGYEIYARYVLPISAEFPELNGKWIVNYSEYTIGR